MIPLFFAPLQGYTDYIYRNIHQEIFGGISAYYTPFIRIEKGEFRRKELRDIDPENNKTANVIPQLIASRPDEFERITEMILQKGYNRVDINMGCPFPLIAGKHKGSGILPHPDEVYNLLQPIYKFPETTFSIKMRLGWETAQESLNLLPLLQEFPFSHITLHPRIGKQQYKGTVNMDGFSALYNACNLPLIYNGDLKTIDDIENITQSFPKLAGIMLGRGLLANPALGFEYEQGIILEESQKSEKIKTFHDSLLNAYQNILEGGEKQILQKMKTIWEYLLPEMEKRQKKKILKSRNIKEYREMISLAL